MARKRKQSQGLGDTVQQVLEVTGIAQAVKFIAGDDCGCEERKAKLNKLFPYKKANCLNETDYNYLTEWFSKKRSEILPSEQHTMLEIYKRTYGLITNPSSCPTCWNNIINELKAVYDTYATT